jgi:hypothetical protein
MLGGGPCTGRYMYGRRWILYLGQVRLEHAWWRFGSIRGWVPLEVLVTLEDWSKRGSVPK